MHVSFAPTSLLLLLRGMLYFAVVLRTVVADRFFLNGLCVFWSRFPFCWAVPSVRDWSQASFAVGGDWRNSRIRFYRGRAEHVCYGALWSNSAGRRSGASAEVTPSTHDRPCVSARRVVLPERLFRHLSRRVRLARPVRSMRGCVALSGALRGANLFLRILLHESKCALVRAVPGNVALCAVRARLSSSMSNWLGGGFLR